MRTQAAREIRRCSGTSFRVLGMALALASAAFTIDSYALNLGSFRVDSALDEPLRAEIEVRSAAPKELKTLEVSLGSPEDFNRAEILRPEFLSELQFEVVESDGKAVIEVRTEGPVREPFLRFLVAAEWNGGKVIREYTGLLDPPLYTATQTPATVEPAETQGLEAPAEEMSATEAQSGATTTATIPSGGAEFGPTRSGDTLWDIASRLNTGNSDINVFQVMMALLRENPEAFVGGNINRLRTGQILTLSDIADIADIPKRDASIRYQAQLEEWQSFKAELVASAPEFESPDQPELVSGEPDGTGTLSTEETGQQDQAGSEMAIEVDTAAGVDVTTATDTTVQASAESGETGASESAGEQAAGDEDVLEIVQASLDQQAGIADSSGSAEEVENLQTRIATLEESLASKELENQELTERIQLLEEQIESAQRIIQLESQELARAQQQAAQQMATEQPADDAPAEADNAQGQDQVQVASAAGSEQVSESQAQAVPTVGSEAAEGDSQSQPEKTRVDKRTETQKAKPVSVAGTPSSTRSWWESILDALFSSWIWMVGAAAGVVIFLIGLLVMLRRRRSIAEFEESILAGSMLDNQTESTESAATSPTDTSFLSDFGMASGMGNMQADEVDPLAEAEVYLAYGRDEQAEEVLKEAARRNPDRHEIKLKLLEIYKNRGDVKSFETIAEELYPADDQENSEIWSQVSAMGRDVNPTNPLFELSSSPGLAKEAMVETPLPEPVSEADDISDFGLDTTDTDDGFDFERARDSDEPGETSADLETAPFPAPDEQEELDRELDRLADERARTAVDDSSVSDSDTLEDIIAGKDEDNVDFGLDGDDLEFDLNFDDDGFSPPSVSDEVEERKQADSEHSDVTDRSLDQDSTNELLHGDSDDSITLSDEAFSGIEDSFSGFRDSGSSSEETVDRSEPELDSDARDEADTRDDADTRNDADTRKKVSVLEFDSEIFPPEDGQAEASADGGNGGSSESPHWDEAATKLDLARAYLDMGDKTGARSIIDEVMREGDPAQRDQAAELASRL